MRTFRRFVPRVLPALSCLLFPPLALCQTAPADTWDVRVVPYAWAAGAGGDVHLPGLPPVHVERGFRDTFSDLDAAAMVVVDARRGAWGFTADLTHVETGTQVAFAPLGVNGHLDTRATTAALLASYRAIDTPAFSLDVLAGARRWDARMTVTVDAPLRLQGSVTRAWTDPVLGLRAGWRPAPRHGVTVWAMGGAVDGVPLDLLASYGYALTPRTWLRVGYRHLEITRRDGSADLDLTVAGPGVGLELRF